MEPVNYLVLDVESVGFRGEAFAFGMVLMDGVTGEFLEEISAACDPSWADGKFADLGWVIQNCDWKSRGMAFNPNNGPNEVRDWFRRFACTYSVPLATGPRSRRVLLAADCPYPVETTFFEAVLRHTAPEDMGWTKLLYPVIDVASIRLAAGLDPLADADRLPNELPKHNPLCDARQSARLLFEALTLIGRVNAAGPKPIAEDV